MTNYSEWWQRQQLLLDSLFLVHLLPQVRLQNSVDKTYIILAEQMCC